MPSSDTVNQQQYGSPRPGTAGTSGLAETAPTASESNQRLPRVQTPGDFSSPQYFGANSASAGDKGARQSRPLPPTPLAPADAGLSDRPPTGEAAAYYYASPPPDSYDESTSYSPRGTRILDGVAPSSSAGQAPRARAGSRSGISAVTGETNARSLGGKSSAANGRAWIPSKWASAFMATVIVEAVIIIVLVAVVYGTIQSRTSTQVQRLKTVSVYLALFLFGAVFLVCISLDAQRLKNTIQVMGVCIFNVALIVTAALEISQVRDALQYQDNQGIGVRCEDRPNRRCSAIGDLLPFVERLLIAVPIIVGLAQVPITFLTYKLWQEYGWQVYKAIGASIEQRQRFLVYQVFQVLLKFDFFLGVGFTVAYLILVSQRDDAYFGLTIAAVPIAVAVLFLAGIAVRREWMAIMALCIVAFIAGAAYFIYQIVQVFVRPTYATVRLTLTFFGIFTTISLFLTLINAIWCMANFGKGLADAHDNMGHFGGKRRRTSRLDMKQVGNGTSQTTGPSNRISLDEPAAPSSGFAQDANTVHSSYAPRPTNPHRLSLD
ncbi:hypothetical protein IE81DRAFT_288670 [Ceraceosorus guamensis]|uniref:Uncharacterized protein n=1 Tax=Ceraceosorus guamensis TaxID=1522189 RepID=A0A316W0L9_9BASI|nr:hypothetical protein IE81DRAFT_288670 [Ceraceosorus guamensis]PWN43396.1 hypothetical protein IE81DRAFT_288670 [Ceraceosorus guamensis]